MLPEEVVFPELIQLHLLQLDLVAQLLHAVVPGHDPRRPLLDAHLLAPRLLIHLEHPLEVVVAVDLSVR